MTRSTTFRLLFMLLLMLTGIRYAAADGVGSDYVQVNLVSNSPSVAPALNTDPNLINPWGIAASPTGPFWVSDQGSGKSTIYSGAGVPIPLIVTVPPSSPPPSGPTGIVYNSTTAFLGATSGSPIPAEFIFATLDGTIDGWNPNYGTAAAIKAIVPGAMFTGLAIGTYNSNPFLYAADFKNGMIDVFNGLYNLGLGFSDDPLLPPGYSPYNIQNINGNLYVAYAVQNSTGVVSGPGLGAVAVFDTDGNFNQQLIVPGGALNAPWGMALAPASFGPFGGDLLVGNFGDGKINAFNPTTGAFIGTVENTLGQPLVNNNLWALRFGNGGNGGNPNTLYFTAGLNNEAGGLLGSIQPVDSAINFQVLNTSLVYPTSTSVSVCVTSPTGAPATGSVKILDVPNTLATLPLQGNGCATWFINPPLSAGTHSLLADYSGDTNNSPGISASVTVTVTPTPTYLSASCGNAGILYSGNYNCNVNVGSEVGGAAGSITYTFDSRTPVSVQLSNGMAQFSLTAPNAGSHTVAISYPQQGNFAASGPSTQNFTVAPATTNVQLTPSNWYPSAGRSLTLTASVTSYSAAPPTSGTVTFYDNGAVIGTGPVGATGQATLTIPSLASGYFSFNAQFGGLSPDYSASSSNYLTMQAH